ncbi:hypothetical protein ACFL2H_00345 [Planctomycetota bacterium]
MNDPTDFIRDQLGDQFLVKDAFRVVEDYFRNKRFGTNELDSLTIVVGKYGEKSDRRFEIAFFRQIVDEEQLRFLGRLEISLRFPISLRNLFLRSRIDYCDEVDDLDNLLRMVHSSRWYRRYATVRTHQCTIRWHDDDELSAVTEETHEYLRHM